MTLPDEFLRIDTPENVVFGYEVAGVGSRFLATLVDTLLLLILQVIVYLVLFLVLALSGARENWGTGLLVAVFSLLAFALFWGYYVFFEVLWNGQSLGKRWVGLRVIRTDGTPITPAESIIRNLVRPVDFLPIYYGVGVVAMFVSGQARRLGDMAAGTLVVHDRATVTLESLSGRAVPGSYRLYRSAAIANLNWPVERLTSQDLHMAENYLRRREQLSGRLDVAKRIAQALLKRMDVPAEQAIALLPDEVIYIVIERSREKRTVN